MATSTLQTVFIRSVLILHITCISRIKLQTRSLSNPKLFLATACMTRLGSMPSKFVCVPSFETYSLRSYSLIQSERVTGVSAGYCYDTSNSSSNPIQSNQLTITAPFPSNFVSWMSIMRFKLS